MLSGFSHLQILFPDSFTREADQIFLDHSLPCLCYFYFQGVFYICVVKKQSCLLFTYQPRASVIFLTSSLVAFQTVFYNPQSSVHQCLCKYFCCQTKNFFFSPSAFCVPFALTQTACPHYSLEVQFFEPGG